MLQYIPARFLTFPLAVVLGVIGYNIEKILMPPKKTTQDISEKGITQQREERLLNNNNNSANNDSNNLDIFTRRHNLFDKNDSKYLK